MIEIVPKRTAVVTHYVEPQKGSTTPYVLTNWTSDPRTFCARPWLVLQWPFASKPREYVVGREKVWV